MQLIAEAFTNWIIQIILTDSFMSKFLLWTVAFLYFCYGNANRHFTTWLLLLVKLTSTSFIYPWVTCDSFKSTCASAKRYSLVVTIHLPVASRFPLFNNKGQKSHFSHFPTAHSLKIHFWYSVFFFLRDIWSYQIDSEIRKWFHFVSCHCES